MRIEQQVKTDRPAQEVWTFLADVPAVASCIPGAEIGESLGDDRYRGRFHVKVGPLSAKLEGEGRLTRDDATRSGTIEGKGVDRRGGSRVSATMSYRVVDQPAGALVDIAADVTLAGPLSQIGRTGLIEDVAKRLTEDFSAALGQRLAAGTEPVPVAPAAAQPTEAAQPVQFDAGSVLRQSLWKRLRAFFRRLFNT